MVDHFPTDKGWLITFQRTRGDYFPTVVPLYQLSYQWTENGERFAAEDLSYDVRGSAVPSGPCLLRSLLLRQYV